MKENNNNDDDKREKSQHGIFAQICRAFVKYMLITLLILLVVFIAWFIYDMITFPPEPPVYHN